MRIASFIGRDDVEAFARKNVWMRSPGLFARELWFN